MQTLLRYEEVSMDHTNNTVYVQAYTEDDEEFKRVLSQIYTIQDEHRKVFVVLNARHAQMFKPEGKTQILSITKQQMYYSDMISAAGFGVGQEATFVQPLWLKDIIITNDFESDYHIVVNLIQEKALYNFTSFNSKYMESPAVPDKIIIDTTDSSDITVKDFLSKRGDYEDIQDVYPRFGVYAGYTNSMVEMLRTYEGNFRYHMLIGRGKTERDYLALQYAENRDKFLIMGS
jgi:hypothetical protein